ncbi:DNA repair protein Rad [Acidimicrobiaceae bacterium]|nr:DNA repair protein Rad [Acidimicrobiaceae bacterium]
MVKLRTVYRCTDCGAAVPKWAGRCGSCSSWNSLVEDVEGDEEIISIATGMALVPAGVAKPIDSLDATISEPQTTGVEELDRVLGGGLVPGSVTLLGGEPGIGKSTLLLQLLAAWSGRTLYVTAEESAQQVHMRAERLDAVKPDLWLVAEMSLNNIIDSINKVEPQLVIIDSIQAIADPLLNSAPGSVSQVRGCAHRLVQEAKARDLPIILVGHVTKDGGLAGPRVLEHVVDTVLSFEGERHHALRLLRAVKHRFGSTNELGLFEMTEMGLRSVPDASKLFLADRRAGVPGSIVVPALEGHRPLLVEVQALTNLSPSHVSPRRSAQGVDSGRLAMLLAVLERRANVNLSQHEVFASVVGGVKLGEPGADLGLCLALVSAATNMPLAENLVACGEVGLAGELRQASNTARRLAEAARLGFTRAIIPASSAVDINISGIKLEPAHTVAEALALAGLTTN